MLKSEKIQPQFLAYDRPSPKLFGFLSKHFSLKKYVLQNNNFVVFNEYFTSLQKPNFTRNSNSNESSLKLLGQQLISSNSNTPSIIQNNFPSENNFPTPNKLFANYYLNKNDTYYYDHLHSKKKINLLNDYNLAKHKDSYEYVR